MFDDKLEVQSCRKSGYQPLVFSDGWRAAVLNDVDRFYRENINELQRHNTSDELFVLLKGECRLLIGVENEAGELELEAVKLEPEVFYTIRRGVWHSHILEKGASVVVVENVDVSSDNTDRMPIVLSEMTVRGL